MPSSSQLPVALRQKTWGRTKTSRWDGNVYGLKWVGQGGTALVFAVDERSVVKVPMGSDASRSALEREREVYQILSRSTRPNLYVLECFDTRSTRGLVLERRVGTLRAHLQQTRCGDIAHICNNTVLMRQSLRWAFQAASGLSFIHREGIIQADVGCHNMLLDERGDLKIADFSGSGIERVHGISKEPLVTYDIRGQQPGVETPSMESDIFALGSALFEMVTGRLPFHDISDLDVALRFANRRWPKDMKYISTGRYPFFAATIVGCWEAEFLKAREVAEEIQGYEPAVASRPPRHDPDIVDEHAAAGTCGTGGQEPRGKYVRRAHPDRTRRRKRSHDGDHTDHTPFHSFLLWWIRRSAERAA